MDLIEVLISIELGHDGRLESARSLSLTDVRAFLHLLKIAVQLKANALQLTTYVVSLDKLLLSNPLLDQFLDFLLEVLSSFPSLPCLLEL